MLRRHLGSDRQANHGVRGEPTRSADEASEARGSARQDKRKAKQPRETREANEAKEARARARARPGQRPYVNQPGVHI